MPRLPALLLAVLCLGSSVGYAQQEPLNEPQAQPEEPVRREPKGAVQAEGKSAVLGDPPQELAAAQDREEVERSDTWVQLLERKERQQRGFARWAMPFVSGGMLTLVGVGLLIEPIVASPQATWTLAASTVPLAAGLVLGLSLPQKRAPTWALTGMGLGVAAIGASFILEGVHGPHEDRPPVTGLGIFFASTAFNFLSFALLERVRTPPGFASYWSTRAQERPRAALKLLANFDKERRRALGISVLSGLLCAAASGVTAAALHDASAMLFCASHLGTTVGGLMQLLFQPTTLEAYATGQMPTPGKLRF